MVQARHDSNAIPAPNVLSSSRERASGAVGSAVGIGAVVRLVGSRRSRVHEAIGTAAWTYRVGDEPFEAQGHRMISDALSLS